MVISARYFFARQRQARYSMRIMKKRLFVILLAGLAILACGCVNSGCSREAPREHVAIGGILPISVGKISIGVQVAVTTMEQEKGLMYRTELADNVVMIFAYKEPQKMRYWMKNVPIPLSIGFFKTDGTLAEIRAMQPNDVSETVSSGSDIRYVLEMNEGWYERHGIRPGDRLNLSQLAKALTLRGEEPAKYGL
jgi:uncharacterized protein